MCDDSLTAVRRTGEVYDKNEKKRLYECMDRGGE